MSEWGFEQWLRFALLWAGIFALAGGIIAMTSEGASWQGFIAGLWRGIEWFLIISIGSTVLFFVWLGVMQLASSLNQ